MNYNPLNRRRALLLAQPNFLQGVATTPVSLPTHDWGFFGEYEYLGPGTPYTLKREAGIDPKNDLDRIAMYHDSQYSWTAQHTVPGARVVTSGIRGVSDYGAGAAMVTAAINPSSDLTLQERGLAFIAGEILMAQGVLRLSSATRIPMAVIDWLFY